MANEIVRMQTTELDSPLGPTHGVMIAVNIDTPRESGSFATHVIGQFKLHRMCSPPDTSVLVISIMGPVDLMAFHQAWAAATRDDEVLRLFLSSMQVANCVHGTRSGKVIETVSLIPRTS